MNDSELISVLSRRGIRPTQQRIAVYKYLLTHPEHPSADTIYRALVEEYPVFSRTTIYNSLGALIEAGLVRQVNICADEQRFDATVTDHGHFFCKECGKVYDFGFDSPAMVSRLCPRGFIKEQGDVFFTGICKHCYSF
ncbi:MAG: transcriptional repressor [Clostridiales bacterium]|jgi:Fur family peroxide stress response transcriptional regulator|nr:transcriptional repressor [Clostridiales bacterium]